MSGRLLWVWLVWTVPLMASAELIDELALEASTASESHLDEAMAIGVDLRAIQPAFDEATPEQNTVVYRYHPEHTYKVRLREYTLTTIILPEWETIKTFTLGDTLNFRFTPMGTPYIGALQMIHPGADTSMVIIGESGQIYTFYIRADSVRSEHLPHFMVYVHGDLPLSMQRAREEEQHQRKLAAAKAEEDEKASLEMLAAAAKTDSEQNSREYLRELPDIDPTQLRYHYRHNDGPAHITPMRVFDDGLWTYFQFGIDNLDRLQSAPAIYRVLDGVDTPVNTRVVNGFIVAELVAAGWTIRAGTAHVCVRRFDAHAWFEL